MSSLVVGKHNFCAKDKFVVHHVDAFDLTPEEAWSEHLVVYIKHDVSMIAIRMRHQRCAFSHKALPTSVLDLAQVPAAKTSVNFDSFGFDAKQSSNDQHLSAQLWLITFVAMIQTM